MPIYTYHCDQCGHEFEKYQSFSEDALIICPECGKETLLKVYKPALVLFKGSGFYVTDTKSHSPTMSSSNGGDKRSASSENTTESSGDGSSEKKTEKKSETKAEKKTTKEK